MGDEVTDEERLQIAQHFLLSSPPCQFQEVLADVRNLLPAGLLNDSVAAGVARVYNARQGRVVSAPSGHKTVLCKAGEVDPTHYADAKDGSVFAVDHMTLTTSSDTGRMAFDPELEDTRAAVQKALDQYVTTKFVAEASAAGAYTKDGKIVVVIVGEKPSLRNFWSGRWSSTWTIAVGDGSATISGDIKIHVHYFEDGNVQLQTSKAVPSTSLSGSSPSDVASAAVAAIKAAESALQEGLEEMYGSMDEETFRAMRRTMPITRTKMDWNISAVRMTRQIQRK